MEECSSCLKLDLASDPGATECVCSSGEYVNDKGKCRKCTEGMKCDSIGNDLSMLTLEEGYWRPCSLSTAEVLDCPVAEACIADPTTDNVSACGCLGGNEGILCAVCSKGYYRASKYNVCEECGSRGEAILSAFGFSVAMAIALIIFVAINRKAPNGLLRPFIDLVQKVTVMLLFDAPFPAALVAMGQVLDGLSFGIEVVSPQCAGLGSDFYTMYGYTVLVLILLIVGMLLPALVNKFRKGWSWNEMMQSKEAGRVFRDLFVVVLLIHPSVSGKSMEFFRCRQVDGESYLMVRAHKVLLRLGAFLRHATS